MTSHIVYGITHLKSGHWQEGAVCLLVSILGYRVHDTPNDTTILFGIKRNEVKQIRTSSKPEGAIYMAWKGILKRI